MPRADRPADAEERYRYALERFGLDPTATQPAARAAASPAPVARDRHGAGRRPGRPAARRADGRHVARGDAARPRACSSTEAAGLTIVVVEHDIAFVREVAQRVTVLHQGRVFAEGTDRRDHRARRTCAASIWAGPDMAAILAASDLRSGYGAGDVLQGVSVDGRRRARSSACSAATASARAR